MIISHQHRYLFIEVPLTASWAIRHELCEFYGGEPILHKHASHPEFLHAASPDEKDYFVFATVRNPLDKAVSRYFKLKTNHKGAFTDPEALKAGLVDSADLEKFRFIQQTDADFESYFLRYHRRPFSSMIDLSSGHLDFVIRSENLQSDFATVLRRLSLESVRPISVMNKTQNRRSDWRIYYTPATVELARRMFGPFMRRWAYKFPTEWGPTEASRQDEWAYKVLGMARRQYLLRFRYHPGVAGRAVRWLRAALIR